MSTPMDKDLQTRLSAYMDGALEAEDMRAVEALLAEDPSVAEEFAALMETEDAISAAFDGMLDDPLPAGLAESIMAADPAPQAANTPSAPSGWGFGSVAAAVALLAVGGVAGGYATKSLSPTPAPQIVEVIKSPGWMAEVAAYHRVYATQTRHLVEVPAAETPHIEKWLSAVTGVGFKVPDLSESGLTFEGARLLVAAGKPVAQLLYTTADGAVVALCFLGGGDPEMEAVEDTPTFSHRTFDDLSVVQWKTLNASYLVIGETGQADLDAIAVSAAQDI